METYINDKYVLKNLILGYFIFNILLFKMRGRRNRLFNVKIENIYLDVII